METNEMKKKNEEILNKWRETGTLRGLKEGSINEWRCAKSYDNMANYCISNDMRLRHALEVYSFAFIRKVLCSGKKRLYRILTSEEIVNFFETVTPNTCFEWVKNNSKAKHSKELQMRLIGNCLTYEGCGDLSLAEFFERCMFSREEQFSVFRAVLEGVVDFQVEILTMACELFVERNK